MASKRPKSASKITRGKVVRSESVFPSSAAETPYWILSTFDFHGPWGSQACAVADLAAHLGHLKGLESMTWASILAASGGKSSGTNSHPLPVTALSKAARDRLEELEREDVEEVVSLRLEATVRLYGIRVGRVLQLLWLDPWHGDQDKAVCPAKKRHT